MNCISDFICDYHSKDGLIESVNIISINDDDCAVRIIRNESLLRTSITGVKILSRPHEQLNELERLDIKQNLILSVDSYSCIVKAIKIHDDQTVEVLPSSDLLLNNESTKRVGVEYLSVCGSYEHFDNLETVSIPMPFEYSRYFNNISIFKPILSQIKNVLISWNAEDLKVKVFAFDKASLKKIEFLMPVFISQLGLLVSGKHPKAVDILSNYIVWEYQYENEEEANYAIGPKGSHILAVRKLHGIAGVVLTKTSRLRIIAENKFALKEARSLLEIKRESYMFDDSFIPILIGKSANHITELVNKAGLHCIHVPNSPWNGVINENVTVNDPSMQGKRELLLFGTRESITSAKLLLEMEESVKDLKKEFELRKNSKLRQSLSLKSSTSSISKDSEKQVGTNWDSKAQEVFDDNPDTLDNMEINQSLQILTCADTHDDSGDDYKNLPDAPVIGLGITAAGKEGYIDFFSTQSSSRIRKVKKNHVSNWNQPASQSPEPRNSYMQQNKINRKVPRPQQQHQQQQQQQQQQQTYQPSGLLFTNSTLSPPAGTVTTPAYNGKDESQPPYRQTGLNRNNRNNFSQNWNSHHNFRAHKNNDRRSYPSAVTADENNYTNSVPTSSHGGI